MKDHILILGAGGFIGRHLAESLAADGHAVIAATRGHMTFPHPGIVNIVSGFNRREDFLPLVERSTAVIHAASASTPASTATQPQLDGNLRTTLALVEALQDAPHCHLLYLSSGGTLYGDRAEPAREGDPLRPRSYHGAGKGAAELFIHAWATQFSGRATVLRPTNVYGPHQLPRRGFGIVPAAFDCALRGAPLTIWGGGIMKRDFLYIDDLVALCKSAVARPAGTGMHVFNAAGGVSVSLNTLIDRIDDVTGRHLQRLYQPARPADVRDVAVNADAARSAFDWLPSVALEDGLLRTWQWFRSRT